MMNGKLKLPAMCAIAAAMFAGCEKSAETTLKSVADTRPRVKTCVVRTKKFAETAFVQGTVRAKTSAAVAARVPGVIDALLAKEGDAVEAGAALFDVDRVNLENAVRAAEDDIRLATAALAQAEAADGKARADLARKERLVKAEYLAHYVRSGAYLRGVLEHDPEVGREVWLALRPVEDEVFAVLVGRRGELHDGGEAGASHSAHSGVAHAGEKLLPGS